MKKLFSIRILLSCKVDSKELFEESLIIVKLNNIDEIKDAVSSYVEDLDEEHEDKIFKVISILDYYEIHDEVNFSQDYSQIYSRFLSSEELELYPEF
ncbi:MAG: hypothetical protein Q4E02_01705 [Lagierella massiliensis]|nr:hypothetical protein [Lagierella massiliensis]